jgi:hypothetical protein
MQDMKALPKNMALVKAVMLACTASQRSHTVPIIMARPMYMTMRMP